MDAINNLKTKFYRITGSRNFKTFTRFGAPMFIFCVGGSYLLEEFQIVRVEYLRNRYDQETMNQFMKEKGLEKVDLRKEYERIQNADTSNYQNVRGPRLYEDNHEFLNNRKMQEKRLAVILGREPPTSNPATSTEKSDIQNTA